MGNTGQQFLAAFLFFLGPGDGIPQPPGHVVEILANGPKFIRLGILNPIGQVSVPNLVYTFPQNFQRLGNVPKYKPCQKTLGENNHKKQQDNQEKPYPNPPAFQGIVGKGYHRIIKPKLIIGALRSNMGAKQIVGAVGNRTLAV